MEYRLRDGLKILFGNAYLQITGKDVAIPFLRGKPGAGKTYSITNICNQSGWGFLSTHFAVKPIEETGGIPQFTKKIINGEEVIGTIWSIPDIICKLHDICSKHEFNLWLLDDAHLLTSLHFPLLHEVLTERSLREYKLPQNVAICFAGNTSNKAGAKTLFSSIVNRVIFMDIYTPFDDWKIDFAIPNNINNTVVSFLQYETNKRYFHEDEKTDKPWGSPRSWTKLANMIDGLLNLNYKLTTQDILYLAKGHIGDGAADFATFWEVYSKYDFDQIFKEINNQKFSIKNYNGYDLYVMTMGLTNYYINKIYDKNNKNKKYYNSTFAKFLVLLLDAYEDLCILSIRECFTYEKEFKKSFTTTLFNEMQKINPSFLTNLNKLIKDVKIGVE